jgi:phosphate starvation-inducible protein PhoH
MNLILFISMISLITTRSFFFPKSKNYLVREIKMKKNNFYNSGKYNFNCNYNPKNTNQYKYVNFLNDNDVKIVMAIGSAGTGKTLFACLKAISLLKSDAINKIIITRPAVSVEEDHGFLPGNINKKMDPWMRPILDIFEEFYSKSEIDLLLKNGNIEISPLAYMRGRTFKNTFIIGDEMQNSSPNQMIMLTTRLGINSKMVLTGDLNQSDKLENNGLKDLLNKVKIYDKSSMVKFIEFKDDDIERSEIVKEIINIYNYKNNNRNYDVNSYDVDINNNNNNNTNITTDKIIKVTNITSIVNDTTNYNERLIQFMRNFNAKQDK